MIVRLDNNTLVEINRKVFLTDSDYYKKIMKMNMNNSPKINNSFVNKSVLSKKNYMKNNTKNDKDFIQKFL